MQARFGRNVGRLAVFSWSLAGQVQEYFLVNMSDVSIVRDELKTEQQQSWNWIKMFEAQSGGLAI